MKICVCFKEIPDYEKVLLTDWQDFDIQPDTSYTGRKINCFDEIALEMALKINEDINATLVAITYGELSKISTKKIYAAGFDSVVNLKAENTQFSPTEVGEVLADYIKGEDADIILTGFCVAQADSGSVPYNIAARLNIPIISGVTECKASNDILEVTGEINRGVNISTVKTPIVLAIKNSEIAGLRLSTFTQQMEASKKDIIQIEEKNTSSNNMVLNKQQAYSCKMLEMPIEDIVKVINQSIKEANGI